MKINIDDKVDRGICPSSYFCTVATTCCTLHERERTCIKCWLRYCKDNNIEVEYEEN